jgi:hypothetical protein
MLRYCHLVLSALLLAACAGTPTQPAADGAAQAPTAQTSRVCEEEPLTGTRIRKCNRDRVGNVEVLTREQLDRATLQLGPAPANPAMRNR